MSNMPNNQSRIVCPKCKGNGYHKEPYSGEQFWLAPFTLGLSLVRDKVKCKVCKGTGVYDQK